MQLFQKLQLAQSQNNDYQSKIAQLQKEKAEIIAAMSQATVGFYFIVTFVIVKKKINKKEFIFHIQDHNSEYSVKEKLTAELILKKEELKAALEKMAQLEKSMKPL